MTAFVTPCAARLMPFSHSAFISTRARAPALPRTRAASLQIPTCCAAPAAPADDKDDFLERIRSINRTMSEAGADSDDVTHLVKLARDDSNAQVRYAALSRLAALDPPGEESAAGGAILEAARKALTGDSEPSCRAAAADLIAGLRLMDGFDDLVEAFNNTPDWVLRFSIVAGVGEMKHPLAFQFLSEVLDLDNNEVLVTTACIGALGDLGDPQAIPIVQKFLDHEEESVRDRAQMAMSVLSGDSKSE